MDEEVGYIYIREHEAYSKYDACKLGKTENIPERDNTYITGEIFRGIFTLVFEVKKEQLDKIEKDLQENYKNLNIYNNGGTEFFKIEIKELIEPYFKEKNIYYKILSEEDIKSLKRKYREKRVKEDKNYIKYLEDIKVFCIPDIEKIPIEYRTYEIYFEAIKNLNHIYEYDISHDPEYCKENFIDYDDEDLIYIHNEYDICCDPDFIEKTIENNNYIFKIMPDKFKTYELCLKLITFLPVCYKQKYPSINKYIPKNIKNNYNFRKELGKRYPITLFNREFSNFETNLEIVKYNGSALFIVPYEKRNYEICLEAVKNYGFAIEYVPEEIITLELCLIAIEEGSTVLSFIPNKFKTQELCIEAVKIGKEHALKCLPDNFKTKAFYTKCIEHDKDLIKYIPKKFKIK